jgi:hypothetical protein
MAQSITFEMLAQTIFDSDWGARYTMAIIDMHEADEAWRAVQASSYHNGGPIMDASKEIVDNYVKIDFRIATTAEYLD